MFNETIYFPNVDSAILELPKLRNKFENPILRGYAIILNGVKESVMLIRGSAFRLSV